MLKTLVSIAILANVIIKGAAKSASYNATIIIHNSESEQVCTEPHEVFNECIEAGDGPRYCSQLGIPIPRIYSAHCTKGCVCEDDYVWDMDGNCIEKIECPCCGDDPNAMSGCGMKYSARCSNSADYDLPYCSDDCEINGCVCREGYVYDGNIEKCVLPDECTPTCSENEEYSTCANQLCPPQDCALYGQLLPGCPLDEYDPDNCEGGCICQYEYLRNEEGMCIPQEDCPEASSSTSQIPEETTDPSCD